MDIYLGLSHVLGYEQLLVLD